MRDMTSNHDRCYKSLLHQTKKTKEGGLIDVLIIIKHVEFFKRGFRSRSVIIDVVYKYVKTVNEKCIFRVPSSESSLYKQQRTRKIYEWVVEKPF